MSRAIVHMEEKDYGDGMRYEIYASQTPLPGERPVGWCRDIEVLMTMARCIVPASAEEVFVRNRTTGMGYKVENRR